MKGSRIESKQITIECVDSLFNIGYASLYQYSLRVFISINYMIVHINLMNKILCIYNTYNFISLQIEILEHSQFYVMQYCILI